jgi:hypothetical protein
LTRKLLCLYVWFFVGYFLRHFYFVLQVVSLLKKQSI